MYIEKMNVGELRKALEGIPDDYSISLESVDGGVAVPDGEDRVGTVYTHPYSIDSRCSEIKYVERDDSLKDVSIQLYLTLEDR